MKVIMEFDLDYEDDTQAYEACSQAVEIQMALTDMVNELFRPSVKHNYAEGEIPKIYHNEAHHEVVSAIEERFYKILSKYNITI